jgi:hypothetical protein
MVVACIFEICRFFPPHGHSDLIAGSLHDERCEIFRALWATALVTDFALFELRMLGWFTATDLSFEY